MVASSAPDWVGPACEEHVFVTPQHVEELVLPRACKVPRSVNARACPAGPIRALHMPYRLRPGAGPTPRGRRSILGMQLPPSGCS